MAALGALRLYMHFCCFAAAITDCCFHERTNILRCVKCGTLTAFWSCATLSCLEQLMQLYMTSAAALAVLGSYSGVAFHAPQTEDYGTQSS